MMQWPEKVNNHLGSDREVNTYAKNIFNEGDFGKVKCKLSRSGLKVPPLIHSTLAVINAVGKMNKEDTSDTMDPVRSLPPDLFTEPQEHSN